MKRLLSLAKIEIYFVSGRLGSHLYQIYLKDFYNARSCFIKSQLRKLYILHIVSAVFLQCKSDVSASFSCGNCTYAKFPNRFRMLKLIRIAKFKQVSVDGNRLEFGTPQDSALRKLAETRNFRTETMRKPYLF